MPSPFAGSTFALSRLPDESTAVTFDDSLKFDALLLEQALRLPAHFAVHAGQRAVEKFDDGDLGAEPPPHRAEFEPDHAGADHQQFLRHLVERQRAGRRHDALLVDLDALQFARHRSRWR